MTGRIKGLGLGMIGGAAGLLAMRVVKNSLDEAANDAIAKIAYERVLHRAPSDITRHRLALALHVAYGLGVAGIFGAIWSGKHSLEHPIRAGLLFGAALWLVGDELALPLLRIPRRYSRSQHLQALASHLGYGLATAGMTRALA